MPDDIRTPLSGGGAISAAAGPASVLLLASVFELAASSSLCVSDGCGGARGFGIAAGAVSFAGAMVLLVQTLALPLPVALPPTLPATATLLLLVWWVVGCIVLTFVGPFTSVGNGYVSTWGALLASVACALPHHPRCATTQQTPSLTQPSHSPTRPTPSVLPARVSPATGCPKHNPFCNATHALHFATDSRPPSRLSRSPLSNATNAIRFATGFACICF